jgi:hypothetical protein
MGTFFSRFEPEPPPPTTLSSPPLAKPEADETLPRTEPRLAGARHAPASARCPARLRASAGLSVAMR